MHSSLQISHQKDIIWLDNHTHNVKVSSIYFGHSYTVERICIATLLIESYSNPK